MRSKFLLPVVAAASMIVAPVAAAAATVDAPASARVATPVTQQENLRGGIPVGTYFITFAALTAILLAIYLKIHGDHHDQPNSPG